MSTLCAFPLTIWSLEFNSQEVRTVVPNIDLMHFMVLKLFVVDLSFRERQVGVKFRLVAILKLELKQVIAIC